MVTSIVHSGCMLGCTNIDHSLRTFRIQVVSGKKECKLSVPISLASNDLELEARPTKAQFRTLRNPTNITTAALYERRTTLTARIIMRLAGYAILPFVFL